MRFAMELPRTEQPKKLDHSRLKRSAILHQAGAPCKKSKKRVFGSVLIERSLARELGDHASIDFGAKDVSCVVTLPLGTDVKPG